MQNSSEFQYIAIDTIHESATNPRRTFDECKLGELAESIRTNGLIQPITVRPNSEGFEIVAGARRFRAAQLAEMFSLPARIVTINDAQALEWQLVENSQRVDVHPYEEAQGFQRLLDMPGYDVATLVEKSGKSAAHVYARLSLLQLIPSVAEAFSQELITASHANLLARLPQEHQANAYEQCWRKDWQDKEPHLLPAKHLSAWIQTNLYLSLADAPFSKEDTTLNPPAGACITCPRRSGFNTTLFADVHGDQCLDAPCFHIKVNAYIDREIAARPQLVQIEDGWRKPSEKRPDAVQRGHFREIELDNSNPDAEPGMPCTAAKTAIVVYGKRVGTTVTVCTDNHCPVHDPREAARIAQQEEENPTPVMTPAPEEETEEEKAEREAEYEQRRKEHQAEEQRRAEERRQQFEREQQEQEAERERRDRQRKQREATFERILANAPETLSAAQLRVLLRAIVNLDPYTFADDLAVDVNGDDENDQRSAEEVLLSAIDNTEMPSCRTLPSALRCPVTSASRARTSSTSSPRPSPSSLHAPTRKRAVARRRSPRPLLPPSPPQSQRRERLPKSPSQPNPRWGRRCPHCFPHGGAGMNRTEQAVRRTLAAVNAPSYDIGILSGRGMFPRMDALTAAQCMARLRYLKYRNANGAHIYFRPSGERRYTLLDDLSLAALTGLAAEGFQPCAVIETSHGNFQAWLKHSRIFSKELGTFAAQLLARRFGADPSAADWRRFGRLPGFTNRKPQHMQDAGLYPFVRLHDSTREQFTAAERFDLEADLMLQARLADLDRQRQSFRPWFGRATYLTLSRFRAAAKYAGRPAAADMAFSIAAFANGWTQSQVADALTSEYLSRNPSQSRRAAYVRRTTAKAMQWVRA